MRELRAARLATADIETAGEALTSAILSLVQATAAAVPTAEPWRLLSLQEAAARLGRSERWLRERVRRRDIGVVRLDGGALAFTIDDLRRFADSHRIEARP